MNILLGSHCFFPSTGGIETASELLATEFVRLGHNVHVVTQSSGEGRDFPFRVVRRPRAAALWREVEWCDVFLQNNISLRTLWPLLLLRRPLFITHQTWIGEVGNRIRWSERLKRLVLRFATSIAISKAIAQKLPTPSILIGNPYDDELFRELGGVRPNELLFVGRLVSDKGADVLLEALRLLRDRARLTPRLTIAGDGPHRADLEQQTAALQLQEQVTFVGTQRSRELAALFNQHKILVVPSRWEEPFGIVALEGIACGCVVAGSAGGGLQEAIGPCGLTFPNGDASALAAVLRRLLTEPQLVDHLRSGAGAHLAQFTRQNVANLYLQTMGRAPV